MADPIEFSSTTLYNVLTEQDLNTLRCAATRVAYNVGEVIERNGAVATHLSLIHSGSVRLGIDGPDGSRFNMSILAAGNSFGEISLFLKQAVRHDAHAETELVLDRLTLSAIEQIMAANPSIGAAMLEVAYARFNSLLDYVGDSKTQTLETRAAKLILEIFAKAADRSKVSCRQIDLAHALGVSRVSMGKALKSLENRKLINIGYGKLHITSHSQLSLFARGTRS